MSGGPSKETKNAASAQTALAKQSADTSKEMLGMYKDSMNKITPFATDRLNNGTPYFNALTDFSSAQNAKAWAPGVGDVNRRFANFGDSPSGMREQALGDLEANRARSFDANLTNNLATNEATKNNAAALLTNQQQLANPLGWNNNAMQGYGSVATNPQLKSGGIGGLLGGIAGGAASAMF